MKKKIKEANTVDYFEETNIQCNSKKTLESFAKKGK